MSSATISFGLVAIPVKLFATGDSSAEVRFNMLHQDCGSRVKMQYYCPKHESIVPRSDLVKGYEVSRGQYVLFSEEEMKALTPRSTSAIEITEFVPASKVDPVYFDKSYYLGPDKGGGRPYRLLAEALTRSGRAALGKYIARGKSYLVLLRPFEGGLILQQLRYADQVRSFADIPVEPAEVQGPELDLAEQLISQRTRDGFHPEEYEDEVRQRILELVERKVAGAEITAAPEAPPQAQIVDLMQALKASLGSDGESEKRKPPKRAAPKGKKAAKSASS